ncbi:MAG: hypothetical protein ACTSSJ_07580 [Candidatus Odinarchaeia archaeon]
MPCPVCGEDSEIEDGFCEKHHKAHENIKTMFSEWKKALNISWEEYLGKIIENDNTGKWAKEVADYLLKNNRK